ncbi:hypothetical protein HMSSN036_26200 [Paenibacillus macerans]|nr:hypothetical protein HMSSN036_26200 [Paenibacillus macerans]
MSLTSPLSAAEQLEATFKAPDPYNAEFAELAKRLYPEEIIEIGRRFSRKRWGRSSCSRINFAEKKSN